MLPWQTGGTEAQCLLLFQFAKCRELVCSGLSERDREKGDGCASGWPKKVPGEKPLVEISLEE